MRRLQNHRQSCVHQRSLSQCAVHLSYKVHLHIAVAVPAVWAELQYLQQPNSLLNLKCHQNRKPYTYPTYCHDHATESTIASGSEHAFT